MGVLGRIPVSETQAGRANNSLRNKKGIRTRLSVINCPKSPAGHGGGIHTVVSESITQMIENQRLDKVS